MYQISAALPRFQRINRALAVCAAALALAGSGGFAAAGAKIKAMDYPHSGRPLPGHAPRADFDWAARAKLHPPSAAALVPDAPVQLAAGRQSLEAPATGSSDAPMPVKQPSPPHLPTVCDRANHAGFKLAGCQP